MLSEKENAGLCIWVVVWCILHFCSMFSNVFNITSRHVLANSDGHQYRMNCLRALVQTGDKYFLGIFWNQYLLKFHCGSIWIVRNSDVHELGDFLSPSNNCLLQPPTTPLPCLGCLLTTSFVGNHRQILPAYEIPHDVLKYLQLGQAWLPQMPERPRPQMQELEMA